MIQKGQLAGFLVDGERTDGTRLLALVLRGFIDRVKKPMICINGEKRRACGLRQEIYRTCLTCSWIEMEAVNSLAGWTGVGTDKDLVGPCRSAFVCRLRKRRQEEHNNCEC